MFSRGHDNDGNLSAPHGVAASDGARVAAAGLARGVTSRTSFGLSHSSMSSMNAWTTGTRTSDSTVELMSPPITAISIGTRNSDPSPRTIAVGTMPAAIAEVVMMIGAGALAAGFHQRLALGRASALGLNRDLVQKNRIFGRQPHQHQDADQRRQAQFRAADQQPEEGAESESSSAARMVTGLKRLRNSSTSTAKIMPVPARMAKPKLANSLA